MEPDPAPSIEHLEMPLPLIPLSAESAKYEPARACRIRCSWSFLGSNGDQEEGLRWGGSRENTRFEEDPECRILPCPLLPYDLLIIVAH